MDLFDSPEEAQFRADLRTWLAVTLPTIDVPANWEAEGALESWRSWQKALFDAGYSGLTWPTAFGGRGADPILASIYREELNAAGAPESLNILGENLAGPAIIHFGTDEQRSTFLRPILTGDDVWCQLFSEPDAGSDLASLRTKATKVEGGWLINGQKVWTSRAHFANNAILLARTGGGARHKGITYFLLPMNAEGVKIRPLKHMLGAAEFNEVFLDDVFVPDSAVVGEVDGGWAVKMATLAFERVAIASGRVNTVRAVTELIEDISAMADENGQPLSENPVIRQKVADLYGRAFVHYLIGQRVAAESTAGGTPGPVSSIGKLYFCPLVDDLADFRLSLEPLSGQFDPDDSTQSAERWLRLAYQSRGSAIAGGSTFIQRNIVSERLLGMPRG